MAARKGAKPKTEEEKRRDGMLQKLYDIQRKGVAKETVRTITSSLDRLPPSQGDLKNKTMTSLGHYFISHEAVVSDHDQMLTRTHSRLKWHHEVERLQKLEKSRALRRAQVASAAAMGGAPVP